MHKPLTVAEKERLAELVAANTPLGEICEVIGRDRWTTRRNINYLARRPAPERTRSPLRLSLAERRRSPEVSRRASRCDPSRDAWGGRRRWCRERLPAMVVLAAIARWLLTERR